ncbi:MAG: sensor domain-containing diguanylate cyclase [Candidatus Omnitrophica bacterium]|nr:sensor domain-containing diguanylate cyclase [Candidatus Omnitrophota bacterium]MBU1924422.1 sensor domain-containing diguanylate cyclase [Candidatus Omnitrophota bacterium]
MDKFIKIACIAGVCFLIFFLIFNPALGAVVFFITFPFIGFSFYANIRFQKTTKELKDELDVLRHEKREILRKEDEVDRKRRLQFEKLKQFSQDLASSEDKNEMLRYVVTAFAKATTLTASESQCFLLIREPGTSDFTYEVGYNFNRNNLSSMQFSQYDEVISHVVGSQNIALFFGNVIDRDSKLQYFLSKKDSAIFRAQLDSLALIPLVLEEKVWGIIVVICQSQAATYIKNEEEFFTLMVAEASIALGSAIHRSLASVDKLTQLYNRTFLNKRVKEEIAFCNRQRLSISLFVIDIDHFKHVNDTYGHQEGDMILKRISQLLVKNVRITDICARYGGEEFVIVLPGLDEKKDPAFSIAERIRNAVEHEEFIVLGKQKIAITISIGVAVAYYAEDRKRDLEAMINKADNLLYQAKREGRNRVCYPEDV